MGGNARGIVKWQIKEAEGKDRSEVIKEGGGNGDKETD